MPQHPDLMTRKHGNGFGVGCCGCRFHMSEQFATLSGQEASYLATISITSLPADQAQPLQAVHQPGDPGCPLDHSPGDLECRQSHLPRVAEDLEHHVLLERDA